MEKGKEAAAAAHDHKAYKSKMGRWSRWGLFSEQPQPWLPGFSRSQAPAPPVPSLFRQMDCSFSHGETKFTAIFLQFNKKFSRERFFFLFFLYVLLLVSGLKIFSLKRKNEENENFSLKKKKKVFLRGWATERFIFLHFPWWIQLKDKWSCSWNIEWRYKVSWGYLTCESLCFPKEYKKEHSFNNLAPSLNLLRWIMSNGEFKCTYKNVEWVQK